MPNFQNWLADLVRHAWRSTKAAQLVEFAVSLPLLVVFVVGIFDFSGAYTLKQKLTNVARDAARAAAADPANDLQLPSAALPASVSDAFQIVDNYLLANKLNDCSISSSGSSSIGPGPETWQFASTANGCTGSGLTIIINRGYVFAANGASSTAPVNCGSQTPGSQTAIIGTCVSVKYAYSWRFGRVASLLGLTAATPPNISANAVAMNEN